LGAFATENKDELCFFSWMYAAYWFSNDTVENKCFNLVQTWCNCPENEANGDLTDENVTAMLA